MRDEGLCRRGQLDRLAVRGDLGLAHRPGQELLAVVGVGVRAGDGNITGLECGRQRGEHADLEVAPCLSLIMGIDPGRARIITEL